ncbi:MAG: phosphonoacetaldehyde reductase [Candidatus Adiutrix sp.]|jgi:alcohol dehydrogenase|nr:phosphonoacetaldehyde reductase [Candidatus Adiutrix sp.]
MTWAHYQPVKIHGGPGALDCLPGYLGRRTVLLVTTPGSFQRGPATALMKAAPDVNWLVRTVRPNPDLDELDALAISLKGAGIEALVALGGGSALDSAKALAAALPGRSLAAGLREGVGASVEAAWPIFAVPTTAGTGSEVTPFATIWDRAHQKKRSLAAPALYPQAAFLEPALTLSLPWRETLWGAMDSLSHSLESLWNKNATPLSLSWAREALKLICAFLPGLLSDLSVYQAREKLQQASLLAGLAISQNRTALAHAMSYPLTLHFGVPHGLAAAFTLPALADLVSARGAWASGEDQALAQTAAQLIRAQNLGQYILEFCRPDEAARLAGEMAAPDRAGNFILSGREIDVPGILRQSLSWGGRV